MRPILVLLACALAYGQPAKPEYRLVRSVSGPSGKVVGTKFELDETRSRFVYPQDKSLVVYFEFDGPPGLQVLSAVWKRPDGTIAYLSADVKLQTQARDFGAYWVYDITDDMPSGVWQVEIRLNGAPIATHPFEMVIPPKPKTEPPPPPAEPVQKSVTMEDLYRRVKSIVWIHKLDQNGKHIDSCTGFVIAPNRVATAFQAIDASNGVELEFTDGRKVKANDVVALNRLQDWAILAVETGDLPAFERGDLTKVSVGDRLVVFNVENNAHIIGGVDLGGRRSVPAFGYRLQLTPSPSAESAGGPLMDGYGKLIGILGGSLTPGSRFNRHLMSVSANIWGKLQQGNAAVPITLIPEKLPEQTTSIQKLQESGALSQPIVPTPNLMYSGTSNTMPKDPLLTPPDVGEFNRKDPDLWVYTIWRRNTKVSKGMLSATIYDAKNSSRFKLTPTQVKIPSDVPIRSAFKFAPSQLEAGMYRVDLFWDDVPVWRTFFAITD